MGEHTVKHREIVDLSSFTSKDEEGNLIGNDKAVVCDCHSQREEVLSTFLKILTAPTMKYNGIKDNLDTDYYLYKGRGIGIDPIGNPHRGEPTELELTPGNVLFFNFSTVPVSVDAYLIDFEADTVTLISIPKMGKNKFRFGHSHLNIITIVGNRNYVLKRLQHPRRITIINLYMYSTTMKIHSGQEEKDHGFKLTLVRHA